MLLYDGEDGGLAGLDLLKNRSRTTTSTVSLFLMAIWSRFSWPCFNHVGKEVAIAAYVNERVLKAEEELAKEEEEEAEMLKAEKVKNKVKCS